MKSDKVVLTKDEAKWFGRNVIKAVTLFHEKAQKDPKVLERSAYKVMKSMQSKAGKAIEALTAFEEHPFEIEVYLSSKQKKHFLAIILQMNQGLQQGVIPKYKQQLGDEPERITPYLEKAEKTSEMLTNMARKFK